MWPLMENVSFVEIILRDVSDAIILIHALDAVMAIFYSQANAFDVGRSGHFVIFAKRAIVKAAKVVIFYLKQKHANNVLHLFKVVDSAVQMVKIVRLANLAIILHYQLLSYVIYAQRIYKVVQFAIHHPFVSLVILVIIWITFIVGYALKLMDA